MGVDELMVDAFGRVRDGVHGAVEGLSAEDLAFRVDADANSIAWLVWHLTRIEDDHVCDLSGTEQVWTREGWAQRFGLPFAEHATGFGHRSQDVGKVQVGGDLLTGYHDAVHAQTVSYVNGLDPSQLDEVIDDAWDPPVTRGVRLVSVMGETAQHVGQAAFVRGLLERM